MPVSEAENLQKIHNATGMTPGEIQDMLDAQKQAKINSVQARATGSTLYDTPGGGASPFTGYIWNVAGLADTFPAWNPLFPLTRDRALDRLVKSEDIIAGAVNKMEARVRALRLNIDGPPRAKKYSTDIARYCEFGKGINMLTGKAAHDMMIYDNGFFLELVGKGRADRPLPKGQALQEPYVVNLDSLQCWRTFNAEFPVVYTDPLYGTMHALHYTRVVSRSSMESTMELARGIGYSHVSRALRYIRYFRDIMTYKTEKVGGRFTRAIGYGNGISAQQFKQTTDAAQRGGANQEFLVYKGIPFILRSGPEEMKLNLLDLASLYDGFENETETMFYVYTVALAFGVDAREFWPATTTGATKADASVQAMKAEQTGIGDMLQTIEGALSEVFPDSIQAAYDYVDDEQDKRRAEINSVRSQTYTGMLTSGMIDVDEARAHAVSEGLLDIQLLKTTTPQEADAAPADMTTPDGQIPDAGENTSTQAPADTASENDKGSKGVTDFNVLAIWHEEAAIKDYAATRAEYVSYVTDIITAGQAGDIQQVSFTRRFQTKTRSMGMVAFRDGLREGGIEDDLDEDDRATLAAWYSEQAGYISDFTERLYEGAAISASNSAEMWANKTLRSAHQLGIYAANKNALYEWVLGATETHCDTCKRLNGQKHRIREWQSKELTPGSSKLDCKGFHCDCALKRATGKAAGKF